MCLVREQVVRQRITKPGRDGEQRVEPSARLIDSLGDEIRRVVALELVAVLEWKMPLGERHGSGIEPRIDHFGCASHRAATSALPGKTVDERLVGVELVTQRDTRTLG